MLGTVSNDPPEVLTLHAEKMIFNITACCDVQPVEMVDCSRLDEVVGATVNCMPLLGFEELSYFGF